MAWNTFWNTKGLVLFITVILLGIVPQNVKGRPQSVPVPTKVEDTGISDSQIDNSQGSGLQIGFLQIPGKEGEPVLKKESESKVPTVSGLLETDESPVPSVSDLLEPNDASFPSVSDVEQPNESPTPGNAPQVQIFPETNRPPVPLPPARNESPRTEDRIIVSDFPGNQNSVNSGTRQSCSKTGVGSSKTITYDDLRAGLETGGVLLIDVRNRTELETTCKLPWSVNVPLHEVREAFAMSENSFREKYGFPKPAPEDTNIVLTCRSGRRIQVARKILEPLGYCDVKLYSGSWLDWKARGGPLFPVFRDGKLLPEKCP